MPSYVTTVKDMAILRQTVRQKRTMKSLVVLNVQEITDQRIVNPQKRNVSTVSGTRSRPSIIRLMIFVVLY